MAADIIPYSAQSSVEPGANVHPLDTAGHPATVSAEQMAAPPGEASYKRLLHDFTQKYAMPLPIYNTTRHGPQHAQTFKSSVLVDGLVFVSPKAFNRAKAAEHDVAKYALDSLIWKMQDESWAMLDLVQVFCKAILNEFAVKISAPMPRYSTRNTGGKVPVFDSEVLFCGKIYTGHGRSKKEAEQAASRVVIENILGNSSLGTVMSHLINSKIRLCGAVNKCPVTSTTAEDQPQTDPLEEFVHQLPDVSQGKKKRNKKRKEEPQSKKQRPEDQQEQEFQDSQVKEQPEEEHEAQLKEKTPQEE